ncbi:hypothetical protein KC19_5G043500 [Ceratodon purpureus]|uniref:16S rRNA (cytosine(967)-C(5))-methyltransferase n=1 Tax=Ceratodon purpureus TaxID=3225 RepID=A0A8T0HYK7_CERPU|nr:hypothetical protein KC19_5G043500 [Ceratodon purpureus]
MASLGTLGSMAHLVGASGSSLTRSVSTSEASQHERKLLGMQRITCSSRNYGREREQRQSGNSSERPQGNARDVRRIKQAPGATKWTRIEDRELGEGGAGRRGNGGDERRDARRAFIPRTATNISSHRAVAVVRLMRIEEGGAFVDVLSGEGDSSWADEMAYVGRTLGFRVPELDLRGRRLVTDVVAGVVRWKRYLDFLIFSFFKLDVRDYDRMEPLLRQILRVGLYELIKLEMPPHAVLNETVQLAKVALRAGAGNLVNGLLRAVVSHQDAGTLPVPVLEGDQRSRARALATIHSHPVWMVRMWLTQFGEEETVRLMECNNQRPTFSLRANSARGVSRQDLIAELDKLEVSHMESPYLPDFVRLSIGMQDVLRSGLLQNGSIAVQDESAGLVVSVVDAQPGDTIIDCCAAPGGKALNLASRLNGQGKIVAVDVNEGRLRILTEAAEQQGVGDVVSSCHYDLRDYAAKAAGTADRVLLDAPCSGLGVLSKRADLRWRRSPEEMTQLAELQDSLLDAAALLVKPGGVLVYSTCSIEANENSERVAAFLSRNREFTAENVEGFVPPSMVSAEGFFVSFPHRHGIDGAFAARMRRSCEDAVQIQ